jgi:hypothetical protein
MKRTLILGSLILFLGLSATLAWMNRTALAAHFLSRQLHVPVSLHSLELSSTEADLIQLWVGNPAQFKTATAFAAQEIAIVSTPSQILGNPLVIDEIVIADIFVGIEYHEGGESNWDRILHHSSSSHSNSSKDYLIRTLVLTNLTVEVTQADGRVKRYPTIPRMEFHNISSKTGFPIEEIEKAIFHLMLQNLMQKFNFLLRQLPTPLPGGAPLPFFPSGF